MKKKNGLIHRRTFLKGQCGGLATLLALPLLEIMGTGPKAFGQSATPMRFICLYHPNGVIQPGSNYKEWWPKAQSGGNFSINNSAFEAIDPSLAPYLSFVRGINNGGGGGNAHMQGISQLTGQPISNDRINRHSISLDQFLADEFTKRHGNFRIKSLDLAANNELDRPNNNVYNNALKNALSFNKDGSIRPRRANLREVFQSYFAGLSSTATKTELSKRDFLKKSVLDTVLQSRNQLFQKLGQNDKQTVEAYFSEVRAAELKIQSNYESSDQCNVPQSNPFSAFSDTDRLNRIDRHSDLTVDLIALALKCDLTRVATYMLGGEAAGCHYQEIGVNTHFHNTLSHTNWSSGSDNSTNIQKHRKIDAYHVSILEKLMKKLREQKEGSGSILDNTAILMGSGLAKGYSHSLRDIPIVIAGGAIQGGKFIQNFSGSNRPSRVHLSIIHAMGLKDINRFGNNQNGEIFSI